MLQAANTDFFNPVAPNTHKSGCQKRTISYTNKASKSQAKLIGRFYSLPPRHQRVKLDKERKTAEEWRDGLVSVRTFFNLFHAGFCSAYVQNPVYMLVVDFREREEWLVCRVATSQHWSTLSSLQNGKVSNCDGQGWALSVFFNFVNDKK